MKNLILKSGVWYFFKLLGPLEMVQQHWIKEGGEKGYAERWRMKKCEGVDCQYCEKKQGTKHHRYIGCAYLLSGETVQVSLTSTVYNKILKQISVTKNVPMERTIISLKKDLDVHPAKMYSVQVFPLSANPCAEIELPSEPMHNWAQEVAAKYGILRKGGNCSHPNINDTGFVGYCTSCPAKFKRGGAFEWQQI